MTRGRTLRKRLVEILLLLTAVFLLWILHVEIAYRQNVSRMPALLNFHRSVITRLSRA
ncbi:MAG TPA: hypothetical protein VFU90_03850 [Candidatus Tumulicola sp.]|nr:hypothetical protein [Candidatus Tumulicola sp.]